MSSAREKIPWEQRELLPLPGELDVLAWYAQTYGRYPTGKRARFLLLYSAGASRQEILDQLRVSEASLERWWTRWVEERLLGLLWLNEANYPWLKDLDPALASEIRRVLLRVRLGRIPESCAAVRALYSQGLL